ncbi:unnamed protein product, partial [Hapterophycus canaliculatus]
EVSGAFYNVDLTQALRNGQINVNFVSRPTLNGRDTVLRTSRDMRLRNGSSLSYGIGLSDLGDFEVEPLFSLSYLKPLKRGRIGFELNQSSEANENTDDAVVLTNLSASYALALTPTMNFSWSIGATLSDTEVVDATGTERLRRYGAQMSYRREVTRDWDLVARFQHS